MDDSQTSEIVFVYTGTSIPDYVNSSLQLALKHSGMEITLIINEKLRKAITESKVKLVYLEDFYSNERFAIASQRVVFEHEFRNGFWLKSLERLYILEQFMQSRKVESIFHAELDQCLFRIDELVSKLESTKKRGLFIPFHSPKAAVASILYCNDSTSLTALNDFGLSELFFLNEMMLIAEKSIKEPHGIFALPTIASNFFHRDFIEPRGSDRIHSNEIEGFVDAAQIGQWVGGIDPRNVDIRSKPKNKYVDMPQIGLLNEQMMRSLSFRFDEENSRLFVSSSAFEEKRLYNIHLHSKTHPWLNKSEQNLSILFRKANLQEEISISGARKHQLIEHINDRIGFLLRNRKLIFRKIRKRAIRKFNWHKSTDPFISQNAFLATCDFDFAEYVTRSSSLDVEDSHRVFCRKSDLLGLAEFVSKRSRLNDIFIIESCKQELETKSLEIIESLVKRTAGIQVLGYVREATNVTLLPLGISNADVSLRRLKKLRRLSILQEEDRNYMILWSVNVGNHVDGSAFKFLPFLDSNSSLRFDALNEMKLESLLLSYAFFALIVDSNEDVNLLWLCIYCGCIPIVIRNPYVEAMQTQGVPIWIVDDFSEVNSLNANSLRDHYGEFQCTFPSKKIWISDWIDTAPK